MGAPRKAKVQLAIGDLVEIDGRCFEVEHDRQGDPTLDTPITPIAELDAQRGSRAASDEDFERLAGDLPADGEG